MSVAVVFPGQVFDAATVAAPLARYGDDLLVRSLAELLGTDDWPSLDCTDPALAGPCTLVAGLLTARHELDGEAPLAAAGHSFGEITALAYAGALSDDDAMHLVARRGELSRQASQERPGAMAAVMGLARFEVEWARRAIINQTGAVLELAAVNDTQQFVLTGDRHAVAILLDRLVAEGAVVAELPIPGAYHSPVMHSAVSALAETLAAMPLAPLVIPVYSAIDGRLHHDSEDFRSLVPRGLVMPVLWRQVVEAMAEAGIAVALDAGPGEVLWRLGRRSRLLRFRSLANQLANQEVLA